jgi:hypothetical protein
VNAPSGYFGIAFGNRQSSTVVSFGLESFASGLLCAVTESNAHRRPVLFVCYDPPMTAPMDEVLPVREGTASAWVISCAPDPHLPALGSFQVSLAPAENVEASSLPAWMPQEWHANSSARGLAALTLLDREDDARLIFGLGHQALVLSRTTEDAK